MSIERLHEGEEFLTAQVRYTSDIIHRTEITSCLTYLGQKKFEYLQAPSLKLTVFDSLILLGWNGTDRSNRSVIR